MTQQPPQPPEGSEQPRQQDWSALLPRDGVPPAPPPPGGPVPPPPPQPPAKGGRPPTQQPGARAGLNGFAVTSLVLGILGSGCLLGIVFGIVALVQVKSRGQRGRGMAIAGIVLSVLWIGAGAILVAAGIDFARDRVDEANNVAVGDCVVNVPETSRVGGLSAVSCAQAHRAEVVEVVELGGGEFPGEAALTRQGQDRCARALDAYSPSAGQDASISLLYVYPTQASWTLGDRQISCLAVHSAPVTGSIRGR